MDWFLYDNGLRHERVMNFPLRLETIDNYYKNVSFFEEKLAEGNLKWNVRKDTTLKRGHEFTIS